jgi:peptide chain release factor subunit 3
LSIGATAPAATPPKQNVDKEAPEAGAKVTAAKALEKSGEPTGTAASSGRTSPSSGRDSPSRSEQKAAARAADAVAQEQAADVDEEVLNEVYGKVGTQEMRTVCGANSGAGTR